MKRTPGGLRLISAVSLSGPAVAAYNAEWRAAEEVLVPAASDLKGRDFDSWRQDIKRMETNPPAGLAAASLFCLIRDEEPERPLGFLDLRRSLCTDWLRLYGGHIGYGVRPSERGKGYAKAMLCLSFQPARERGLRQLVVGHLEENTVSGSVNLCLRRPEAGTRHTAGRPREIPIHPGSIPERWEGTRNMTLPSSAPPRKTERVGFASPLLVCACMVANTGLAVWLRELLSSEEYAGLAIWMAVGFLFGFPAVYAAGGCVYILRNLFSARRRRVGIGISWNRVFPAVCRMCLAVGYWPAVLFLAGSWVLPAEAAALLLYPAGFLAAVPLAAAVLLRRSSNAMPESRRNGFDNVEAEETTMRFVIATHNAKKLKELSRILSVLDIEAVTGDQIGVTLTEPEETGTTFEENAYIKAAAACRESGLPAVADDSGLMVDALDGAPGVYSARYAGEGASDADRNAKLLHALADVPKERRTAQFVSVVCCVFPDGSTVCARGECPGYIGFAPRGEDGFGYDPLFLVAEGLPGAGKSFAELTGEEKDAVSHRGNALRVFSERLREKLGL